MVKGKNPKSITFLQSTQIGFTYYQDLNLVYVNQVNNLIVYQFENKNYITDKKLKVK